MGDQYISEQLGKLPEEPELDYIKQLLEQENIQYGASDFVVGAAYQIAQSCMDNNDMKSAMYYLYVVYDLTHDDEIKKILEKIRDDLNEETADNG